MDKTNTKVLNEEKRIEATEEEVLNQEKKIERTLASNELKDFNQTRRAFVNRIAKHKFIFTLIASTGIILVWRGIWELTSRLPILSDSFVALILGVGILWLIERYSDLE